MVSSRKHTTFSDRMAYRVLILSTLHLLLNLPPRTGLRRLETQACDL